MIRPSRAIRGLLAALLLSAGLAQAAVEVGGVDFAPQLGVDASTLTLNGAGLRTRLGFKVYAMGLYLHAPQERAEAILADKREKRIRIVLTRDLKASQFGDALLAGLEKNHEPSALDALKPATDTLLAALEAVGEVASGTEIILDQTAAGATRLLVNGQQQGAEIGDKAFYPALLRIWLGARPADSELREALLSKPQ